MVNHSLFSFFKKSRLFVTKIYFCHKVKHIFYTIPIFEVMENSLIFGLYSMCTLVFWLPNLDKFDKFHSLLSMNGKLTTQYCPGVDMQEFSFAVES